MRTLQIPDFSLVLLIGASGSGKSTFARRHFLPTEILSSDAFRALVADDEGDQSATDDAFRLLQEVAATRLARRRLTVIDATNAREEDRRRLVELARSHHALAVALVLHLPPKLCAERNQQRPDRNFGERVIHVQASLVRRSIKRLGREGFQRVHVLDSPEAVESAQVERRPLWTDLRGEKGPFDIIGDVHGCLSELRELLAKLGYTFEGGVRAPEGRKAIFLGDLVDRGPDSPGVLRLVQEMVQSRQALCVPGNHDVKLLRKLNGADVTPGHGLAATLEQLGKEPPEFLPGVRAFLADLVSHYWLDGGRLVVAHAGLPAEMHGRASGRVREFALYGETTGEIDSFGLPVRVDWAASYRGSATVVYGHTPVLEPEWLNRTINIDTGCVFGGKLTALRYPEREIVQVRAAQVYSEPVKPIGPRFEVAEARTAQQLGDDLLDLEDVCGKRRISTRLRGQITIREENAAAALETISRFSVDPHWLVYLPPTMSPSETTAEEGLLEHPLEAFEHFRSLGAGTVVCEEKHMGSRAIIVLLRTPGVAIRRFGLDQASSGVIYTRTGRAFFQDPAFLEASLRTLREAFEASGLWEELGSDWALLDAEILPWSAKAGDLIRNQYAQVGAAARCTLGAAARGLEAVAARHAEVGPHLRRLRNRAELADRFVETYRRYSWRIQSPRDLQIAPFHLLASESGPHFDRDHLWHLERLGRACRVPRTSNDPGPRLLETPHRVVDLADSTSCQTAVAWWCELTEQGGEGIVVKPLSFLLSSLRGLEQPAVKCRGREYLRIIYGPEYTLPENLARLRRRGLGAKRSLALREFALGVEGVERFCRREPLRSVHECAFGVLALESEPVDPRL